MARAVFSIRQCRTDIVRPVSGRLQTCWIIVLALTAFIASLGYRAIATSHEARVAQTAREMAAVGWPWNTQLVDVAPVVLRRPGGTVRLVPDEAAPPIHLNPWMVPLLKGEIRLQKPPLPYWCDAFLFRLVGFSEWSARLVPAALGALATLLIYSLAASLLGPRRAIYAAVAWVSMEFIPETYRLAMADPYLSFFTLLCLWAWVGRRAIGQRRVAQPASSSASASHDGARLLIFYASMGFGLLSKGPPLFVHLAIALGAYHFCFRRRMPGTILQHLAGLALLLAIALPWPLYVLRHVSNAVELWRYESVGEITDNVENARPWWFYLPNVPLLLLPWALVGAVACVRAIGQTRAALLAASRRRQVIREGRRFPVVGIAMEDVEFAETGRQRDRERPRRQTSRGKLFATLWLCITVLFFTCVHLKKNPYLLPMMPAAALLVAQGMGIVLAGARRTRFTGWPGFVVGFQAFLGAGLTVGAAAVGYYFTPEHGLLIGIALATLAIAVMAIVASRDHAHIQRWIYWQAATYVLLGLIFSRFILAPQDNARAARLLGPQLAEAAKQPGYTIMVPRLPEEIAIYLPMTALRYKSYLPHQLVVVENRHDPATLDRWFPGQTVLMATEVPLSSTAGEARWKVYDVWVEARNYARGQ